MTRFEVRLRVLIPALLTVLITAGDVLASEFSTAPSAEAFGTLPNIYDAAISPDGAQIAIIVNINGEYGVRILSLRKADEDIRAILLGDGGKPRWVKWVNNERVLVGVWESKDYNSVPITISYIYTLDAESLKGKILIETNDILRQDNSDVIDFLENDPEHIMMAFSDRDQSLKDVYRVNVKTGRYLRVERSRPHVQNWVTDGSGEVRVGQGLINYGESEAKYNLIIRDVNSDEWTSSDEYPGLAASAPIYGFTGNPNELIIGNLAGQDTLGIYIYDLGEKEITRKLFHNDTYDAQGVVLSSSGEVIGAKYVADSTETELFGEFDTVMARMRSQFAEYTIDFVDQSRDGRYVLFKASNAYDPGALAIVDANNDDVSMLGQLRSSLPSDAMGLVSNVKYKARDGTEIPAYMTLPLSVSSSADLKNLPFVILPHGGPYARKAKRFDYFAQYFATRGFVVLQMNFRGSAGYGQEFETAGRENWIKMQEDVEDGTKWVIDRGFADPGKICIAGWSYGGYAALIGAIKSPELYACAISMAGVTDLKDMISDIRKYRFGALAAQNFILRGLDGKQELAENSPVERAEELVVPLFLAHGEADQRVHFDQFKRMKSALKKSPAKVTYMTFDREDHFLSNQANRQEFFRGLDKFLEEVLADR